MRIALIKLKEGREMTTRISKKNTEREVNVYNIVAEHVGKTGFELTEMPFNKDKYTISFNVDSDSQGERIKCAVSEMSARELHFFMQGVWAGENKTKA